MAKTPPSKEELLTLIAEQKAESDVSALPYKDQQDFVLDPNHPLRAEMKERDKVIRKGLNYHITDEAELELD